jgi:predicted HicB family RNase H-like nuclease
VSRPKSTGSPIVRGIGTLYYDIPDDLHRRLKIEAATRGITLKALLIEALEQVAGPDRGTAAGEGKR